MRSREQSSRENRRFSSVEKRPEDFFHGLFGPCGGEDPLQREAFLRTADLPRSRPNRRIPGVAGYRRESPMAAGRGCR